jgi:hypothetical protein
LGRLWSSESLLVSEEAEEGAKDPSTELVEDALSAISFTSFGKFVEASPTKLWNIS